MSETTTESDEDRAAAQAAEAGATAGSGGADILTAGAPASSQPDANELARRKLQSDLDRERADRRRVEAELETAKGQTGVNNPLDAPTVAAIVRETLRRESAVRDVAGRAATLYPAADPALLADPDQFGSPEAYELALKESHERNAAWQAAERERIAADVRKEYGIKLAGAPAGGGAQSAPAATDQLTAGMVADASLADLDGMTDEQLKALAHSLVEE